jgi:hypothetical protein
MARELKLWNGRHPNGRGSVYAAGYTKKQVIEMLELAYPTGGNINSWNRELDIYWSKCWGNSMDGITPEVGAFFLSKPLIISLKVIWSDNACN